MIEGISELGTLQPPMNQFCFPGSMQDTSFNVVPEASDRIS